MADRSGGIVRGFLFLLSSLVLLTALVGVGGAVYVYAKYGHDLPDVTALRDYKPSLVTRVYDDSDSLVSEYYVEKRILTPLERIPQTLILATIAVEDSSFFEHHGLNLEGIVRAMYANFKAGRVVEGGSSITQQVAKQLLLTTERTFERKIKEAILSVMIDSNYSKNEILDIYLNHIYYGHGAYGVAAAALTYFGKRLDELSLAEIAMIASLPKAPTNYSPYNHPKRAKIRRSHSLTRMAAIGAITHAQREEAEKEEFDLAGAKKPVNNAPWFSEHVRRYIEKKYGAQALYRRGLIVRTTLDLDLQGYADKAVTEGLEETSRRLGYLGPVGRVDLESGEQIDYTALGQPEPSENSPSLFIKGARLKGVALNVVKKRVTVGFRDGKGVIDLKQMEWAHPVNTKKNALWVAKIKDARKAIKPGDIVMVRVLSDKPDKTGAYPLALDQIPDVQSALLAIDPRNGYIKAMVGGYDPETSKFNRAIQAQRQAGSSFKPIVYTAALEKGLTPSSIIIDSPIIYDKALTKFKGWRPTNFEEKFFGPTTIREAVTHSRNVVTIKVLDKIGVKYTADFARERFGITSKLDENLSMGLGASPVTLLEMVTSYATLANMGVRPDPMFIKSVEDSDGNTLEEKKPAPTTVLSSSISYLMTNIMTGVVQEGTARRVARAIKRPIAGKTGTTNNNIDAWFIGFTPDLVCGVWVGRDDNKPIGRKETGSRAAIPTWISFMQRALDGKPVTDFTPPEDIVFVRIDKKTGLLTRNRDESSIFESFIDGAEPVEFLDNSEGGPYHPRRAR